MARRVLAGTVPISQQTTADDGSVGYDVSRSTNSRETEGIEPEYHITLSA